MPAQTTRTPPPAPSGETAREAPAAAGLNDAQIAAIASTSNQIEVEAAKLALSKTKNAEVEELAKMMVTDHGKADEDAKALLQRLDMTPEESDLTRQMKKDAASTKERLQAMTGADFDKAYVSGQVDAHQKVLDKLDTMLIPGAGNADLKALLTKVRPVVAAHLHHAQALDAKLK